MMKKSDVEFHSDHFGPSNPAVNVKVYGSIDDVKLPLELGRVSSDDGKTWETIRSVPEFTMEWVREELSDSQLADIFNDVCSWEWEYMESQIPEIFPDHDAKLYSEGRSGGWAVVHNLPDVESWDAIMLGRWAKFSKMVKAIAEGIPRQMVESIYVNIYEPEHEDTDSGVSHADTSRN